MKSSKTETLELVLLLTLFTQLFCSLLLFLWSLDHDLDLSIRIMLAANLPIVLASFLAFGAFRLLAQSEQERQREEQETRLQLEQSYRLVDSLEAQRHDFRNQLQVIRTLAAMRKHEEIEKYIDECGVILNNVAGFAKVGNAVLQALFLTFESRNREAGIKLEIDCQADLRNFDHSLVKVSRIFANLLQNASEAVAGVQESPTISVAIWQEDTGYHFVFWDNGPGIPPEDQQHIFEARFSQKGGKHHGLGLYIVKSLTEELGGTVSVYSNEEEGTEFHIWLPAERRLKHAR